MPKKEISTHGRLTVDIPNVLDSQDHVYRSPQEMEIGLKALLNILGRRTTSKSEIPSYILDTVEVEFYADRTVESIWADHKNARLVVLAPKRKNESETSLQSRRRQYLLDFSTVLDELKTRGLTQAYRTLTHRAREQLKTEYRKTLRKPSRKPDRNS